MRRFSQTKPVSRGVFLLAAVLMLSACGGEGDGAGSPPQPQVERFAVTVTAAPDFSSGATSVIHADPPRTARNALVPTISDLAVACHGRYFFRIERFMADNVAKFDVGAPDRVLWQTTTQDPTDTVSSNPGAMAFVSDTKAYLLRYGSRKAWIVDPSTPDPRAFKTGELDLSAYDEGDGVPEMQAAVVVGDKLFVVMQRLNFFVPTHTAFVAVFDVDTDTEIDTGRGGVLKGIPLQVRNPMHMLYDPATGLIYVAAAGRFAFGNAPAEYTGGIETIDPETFETRLLVDDGTADHHPLGQILDAVVAAPDIGYLIGSEGFQNNTLYRFDPQTGAVVSDASGPKAVLGLTGLNLTHLAVDEEGRVWIGNGDPTAPGMIVLAPAADPAQDALEDPLIGTVLNPMQTCFARTGG